MNAIQILKTLVMESHLSNDEAIHINTFLMGVEVLVNLDAHSGNVYAQLLKQDIAMEKVEVRHAG